jgi:cytochrome b subunit of formate dehydrogenase
LSYVGGESNYFKVQPPSSIQPQPSQVQGVSTGQFIMWGAIGLTTLVLLISVIVMLKKGTLMNHKRQVAIIAVGIVLLAGISLIGVINV